MNQSYSRAKQLRSCSTMAERKLWARLRRKQLGGYKFRRQAPIGDYIVDFFCVDARLVIELDGKDHLDKYLYDNQRLEHLCSLGYAVLRFSNHAVFTNSDWIINEILDDLPNKKLKITCK